MTEFPWQVETVDGRVYAQFVLEIDAHFFAKTAPGMLGVARVIDNEWHYSAVESDKNK